MVRFHGTTQRKFPLLVTGTALMNHEGHEVNHEEARRKVQGYTFSV